MDRKWPNQDPVKGLGPQHRDAILMDQRGKKHEQKGRPGLIPGNVLSDSDAQGSTPES